ncbi:hypothetical protein F4810DRAFT_131814 [Camillea tinctor]|nr:hypothetical protein F4810DRAFT_131814 [Camillea tinctor]
MCIDFISTYPCGHIKSRSEYCMKAKASNLLRMGKPDANCNETFIVNVEPDLEDGCGSTCLTKPYKCLRCESPKKQVRWRCSSCESLRDSNSFVWDSCQCPCNNRHCREITLGKSPSLCEKCVANCVPSFPMLSWKCHSCEAPNLSLASEMVCSTCSHKRCGSCRALFNCSCRCRCPNRYVEGESKPCSKCEVTCL